MAKKAAPYAPLNDPIEEYRKLRSEGWRYAQQEPEQVDDAVSPQERSWGDAVTDTSRGLASGVGGLVKGGGALYGLATGDMDNAATELGDSVQQYWEEGQSQQLKDKRTARKAAIDSADGTLAKAGTALWETIADPALAVDTVATNAATMLPGMAAGRLASGAKAAQGLTAASKFGPASMAAREAVSKSAGSLGTKVAIGTGAVQQGADVSQSVYEDAMKKPNEAWVQNPEFMAAFAKTDMSEEALQKTKHDFALSAARVTMPAATAISVGANMLPGANMLERALVGNVAKTTGKGGVMSVLKSAGKGALGEMTEEGLEEGGGAFVGNVAKSRYVDPNQDLSDSVGENAGMGMAGGLLMGGGGGAVHGLGNRKPINPAIAAAKLLADQQVAARKAAVGAAHIAAATPNSPIARAAAAANPLTPEEAWEKAQQLDAQAELDEANGVAPEKTGSTTGFTEAFDSLVGGGVSEDFYRQALQSLKDGRSTVAGVKDPILKRSKAAFDAGLISSVDDLRTFEASGYPATATIQDSQTVQPTAPPTLDAQIDLSGVDETALRERMNYLTGQAKINGWDKQLTEARNEVAREINARAENAAPAQTDLQPQKAEETSPLPTDVGGKSGLFQNEGTAKVIQKAKFPDYTVVSYGDGKYGLRAPTNMQQAASTAGPAFDAAGLNLRATEIDKAAHESATSDLNDKPQPTDGQKEAGNYAKGHIKVHGMDMAIENPKGSIRSGVSPDGSEWSNTMGGHYGYFKGTIGNDKDHVDGYVGPNPESNRVFVIDQVNKDGSFDEHKVMISYDTPEQAREAYMSSFGPGWTGLGAMTELPVSAFKSWVKDGTKKKPLGDIQAAPDAIASNAAQNPSIEIAQDAPAAVQAAKVSQPQEASGTDISGAADAAIEAKADEIMGLIEAMGGNTSITKESTIALIREKGMDAADKSIAGFKKHIADTKKQATYRDKSQPQEQLSEKTPEAEQTSAQPEATAAGNATQSEQPAAEPAGAGSSEVNLTTVEGVARAVQLKVATNRRKSREKSRKEREAKGYAPNSTPESEQAGFEDEIAAGPSELQKKSAEAMLGTDPIPLIQMFVHGQFDASEDVFRQITGVKIHGLSAAAKKAALYKWANWTPEQIAEAEAEVQARKDAAEEKYKQYDLKEAVFGAWIGLDRIKVKEKDGTITTGQDFVLKTVASGFDKAHSQKKGAAIVYGLTDGEHFTTLKTKEFTSFVKSAIAFGGLDNALKLAGPAIRQAPDGFVDRSVDIGGAKDDGMTAKAFSKPDAESPPQAETAAPTPEDDTSGGFDPVAFDKERDERIKTADADLSKNTPKVDTSAEPVQKDAESEQVKPELADIAKATRRGEMVSAISKQEYDELTRQREARQAPTPEVTTKAFTPEDVKAAERQALGAIQAAIDGMKGESAQRFAAKFLPKMGVPVVTGKAKLKTAMADPKINLLAAASDLGVGLADSVSAALRAKIEGRVSERVSAEKLETVTHAGLKLYPIKVKVGDKVEDRWGVQTLNNAEREKNGERQLGGDPLADTLEQAKVLAEQEVVGVATLDQYRADIAEAEQARQKATQDVIDAKRNGPLTPFLNAMGYTPMQAGAARKALAVPINNKDFGVLPRQALVEKKIEAGYLPRSKSVDKIKPMTRVQFNRADQREQDDHEKKIKDGGKVTEYGLWKDDGGTQIGRYEYDYANYLIGQKDAPAAGLQDSENKPRITPSQEPPNIVKSPGIEVAPVGIEDASKVSAAKAKIMELDSKIERHKALLDCLKK